MENAIVSMTPSISSPFKRFREELNYAMLICGQCGVPACSEGDPGVGKTDTLRALAAATQRNFFSYELSRSQPEDLQGFPVVDEYVHQGATYKYMRFVKDERLLKAELELSIMLMDEVTNVIAPKQAPALNLISQGIKNCWMFMACNPIETAADGQPLTCPFINRIWYGKWEVDEEAQDYGLKNYLIYPEPAIPLVPKDYMIFQPKWGNLAVDYLSGNPADRNQCPKTEALRHMPWPSSRTWSHVTRCLAGVDAVGASNVVRDSVINGLLGSRVGPLFITYVNNLDLPTPRWILDNARIFKLDTRYDINAAIIQSVLNYLERNDTDTNFAQALELLGSLKAQSSEMSMVFAGGLRSKLPHRMASRDNKILKSV